MPDAPAPTPAPCQVVVTVHSRIGDGTPTQDLIDKVTLALQADNVRPLTDQVIVQGAEVLPYQVSATLKFFAGPDRAVALAEAQKRTAAYADEMHRLGMEITLDGLYAAMRAPGVQKVILDSPLASISVSKEQAAYCTSIELIDGGVYE